MKKQYITPEIEMLDLQLETPATTVPSVLPPDPNGDYESGLEQH